VVDSREKQRGRLDPAGGGSARAASGAFTTYERIDEIPYMVVKKDGRRERFDRQKVLNGLLRACEKRPVSSLQLKKIVDATETFLVDAPERERTTSEIGELIMEQLKGLDTVALHSLLRRCTATFKDVREFKRRAGGLLGSHGRGEGKNNAGRASFPVDRQPVSFTSQKLRSCFGMQRFFRTSRSFFCTSILLPTTFSFLKIAEELNFSWIYERRG